MQFHQRESGICSHPSQNSDSRRRRAAKTKRPPVKLQKYASEHIWGSKKRHFHPRGVEKMENMQFYRGESKKKVCTFTEAKVASGADLLKTRRFAL